MIRNVIIHISNEQPLLADLFELPKPGDVSLVCTNVRMLDGTKPIFIDHTKSTFVFPYLHIRFIEMVPGSQAGLPELDSGEDDEAGSEPAGSKEPENELELDEDFLQRIRDV